MYKALTLILLLFFVHTSLPAEVRFRVMFYNVENLFDTSDHPKTDDNEFLPQGNRHWTYTRYKQKLQQHSKVILAASEWQYPELIGSCEVENETVVQQLISQTALHKSGYQQVITQGVEPRGIEVGLLYQSARAYV